MPNEKNWTDTDFGPQPASGIELPRWPGWGTGATIEDIARLEAKIDRLLELLEGNKGLWIAPAPDEGQGHWTGIKIGDGE